MPNGARLGLEEVPVAGGCLFVGRHGGNLTPEFVVRRMAALLHLQRACKGTLLYHLVYIYNLIYIYIIYALYIYI